MEEALINQQIQQFQMDLQKYQLGYQADRDAVSDSQWQQQFGYTTSQAEKENLIQTGTMFLQAGLIPPQSSLDAIGITATDAQSLINAIKLASGSGSGNSYSVGGAGSGSGSGSKSSTGTKSAMTLTTAKQAASNGYFDDNVLSVLHENGYSDEMLKAIYGYDGPGNSAATGNAAGQSANNWDGIDMNSVTALGYGPVSRSYLEQLVDSGVVEAYEGSNGLIQFRKTGKAPGNPMGNLFQINL